MTLERFLLNPIADVIHRIHAWMRTFAALQELELPDWWYNIASPVLAIVLDGADPVRAWACSSDRGCIARSTGSCSTCRSSPRFTGPSATSSIRSVAQLRGGADFKRVVLVEFPHPGIAIARTRDQFAAGRHHRPDHPDGLCADGSNAAGRIHLIRAGRVGDQHRAGASTRRSRPSCPAASPRRRQSITSRD